MCFDRFLSHVGRLACLVVLLAGCVQARPVREPATISFAFPAVDAAHYETLVPKFAESHPQITVELRPKTWQQIYGPDAEVTDVSWVPHELAGRLSGEGKIMNLRSLIEQDEGFDLSDFYPVAVDALSHEGRIWAIPFGVDMAVIYYNRDLFDQYNAPYPQIGWTWDGFLERAVIIRDPEAFVFGYGPRLDLNDAIFFIYQHGGQIFDDLEDPRRTTFDDLLTIEALDWYARLVHAYDAACSLNQASQFFDGGSYAVYQGIRTGKVGMWMGGLSERGGQTWPFKWTMAWGIVPLPSDTQSWTEAVVEGYAISSSTEHPNACWEWITWLSEQVPYRLMPARRSLAESSAYEELVGADVAAVARASIEHAFFFNTAALGQFEGAMEALGGALRDILEGYKTPLEAMEQAQRLAAKSVPGAQ
jgi:ABC-type glycerol-3-phosphate transport system substrate-binding protein